MVNRWFLVALVWVFGVLFSWVLLGETAVSECSSMKDSPVKVEAWLSKQYKKNLSQLRKEFSAMGNTRVTMWVYPGENPSKIVAIGGCVPAYIARHILRKAIEYSAGVDSLVHQGFISPNYVGVGTSLFAESSFRSITQDQLIKLMDGSFDTQQFQSTYRELTIQQKKVKAFGLLLDNPKLLKDP